MTRRYRVALAVCLISATVRAAADDTSTITLRSALAPSDGAQWNQPATFAYLKNADGTNATQLDAAVSGVVAQFSTSDNLPLWETKLGVWWAKNTITTPNQNAGGLQLSIGNVLSSSDMAFVTQGSINTSRDVLKGTNQATLQGTVDFADKDYHLSSCGHSFKEGCTYWDLDLGFYYSDILSSPTHTGLGAITGLSWVAQISSSPFTSTTLSGFGFSFSIQKQFDLHASSERQKQNFSLYKATIEYKFYDPDNKQAIYKPSLALQRVIGSDVLKSTPYQVYTELQFRLAFN